MAVDFPNDRPEAGLGTGPLQEGDSWRFNSIEYTWVLSPDGTGMWSSKGINVNPNNYIAKTDGFSGDIDGYYSKPGGFNVLNAESADEADKVKHSLTLRYVNDAGAVTTTTYDGSTAETFTFTDTDDATSVITITGGDGIDVVGTDVRTDSSVARVDSGYVTNSAGTRLRSLGTQGTLTINQGGTQRGIFDGTSNVTVNLDAGGGGGGDQDLQSVLNNGASATGANAIINLSNAGNQVFVSGTGSMEICRTSGPFIDFKNNRNDDYDTRISQSSNDLILESRSGNVFVNDSDHGTFQITPGGGGGGGGASSLNELSDVSTTNPSRNDVLSYNGTRWVNSAPPEGTGNDLGEVFSLLDYTGSDTSRFQQALDDAIDAVSSNEEVSPCVYIPGGRWVINGATLDSKAAKAQIQIFGNGTQGSCSNLVFTDQFLIQHPVNISGITITTSSYSGSALLFRRPDLMGDTTANGQRQDDMDTSITNCIFGANKSAGSYAIDYRGRNLILSNNRFKTGGQANAVALSYYSNENEREAQDENGWKRIHITNNNFHNWINGAIHVYPSGYGPEGRFEANNGPGGDSDPGGDSQLGTAPRGFIVANNDVETQGSLIQFLRAGGIDCVPETCVFSANTSVNKSGNFNFIQFTDSGANGCAVTGNVIQGVSAIAKFIDIQGGTNNAVTGNVGINTRNCSFNCTNSVISGNVMQIAGMSGSNLHEIDNQSLNIRL